MSAMTVDSVTSVPLPRRLVATQGTLALDLGRQLAPPTPPAQDATRSCSLVEVDPRMRDDLERWVERYVQAALEIVAGDRPAGQLTRWTTAAVHQDLVRRSVLVGRAGGHEPGRGRRPGLSRPQVHRVRLGFLTTDVVEAAIHVRHGHRSRAVAGRFEVQRSRWVCTALEFC